MTAGTMSASSQRRLQPLLNAFEHLSELEDPSRPFGSQSKSRHSRQPRALLFGIWFDEMSGQCTDNFADPIFWPFHAILHVLSLAQIPNKLHRVRPVALNSLSNSGVLSSFLNSASNRSLYPLQSSHCKSAVPLECSCWSGLLARSCARKEISARSFICGDLS